MSIYTPDSWKIVLIETPSNGKVYKVLASWYGGFAGSSSWKLSSGITSIKHEEATLIAPQSSGSTYILHKNAEHISSMIGSLFSSFGIELAQVNGTISFVELQNLPTEFS